MNAQFRDYNIILDSIDGDLSKFEAVKKMPFAEWSILENRRRVAKMEKDNKNNLKL